nr:MAG TPA: hypothetical protein [Caudoviricetes sp.]
MVIGGSLANKSSELFVKYCLYCSINCLLYVVTFVTLFLYKYYK